MKKLFLSLLLFCVLNFGVFGNALQLYEEGKKLQTQGDWYGAIECYKTALIENPSYNLVFQSLAECFYELDEYDQALDYAQKALRYKTNSAELKNLQGFILIGMGDLKGAGALFNEVLKTAPNDVDARFGLAEIEVSSGKLITATELYKAALARQGENRKALLSLALLSFSEGEKPAAKEYIKQALKYHGDNPDVHYFAAYMDALENDAATAEARLRSALKLSPSMDKAKRLLSTVLYTQGRYSDAIRLADERLSVNRNLADAWYLKTLGSLKQNNYKAALQAAKVGLSIEPNNEIMRSLLETIAIQNLNHEDAYRKQLAEFHEKKARTFANLNNIVSAVYEYRQALRVYPYNTDARFEYAKLLLRQGYYERYLEQLQFIQSITKSNTKVNDAVEAYGKLLSSSLQSKWSINPLYLSKQHISIALFYGQNAANVLHPESEKIATKMTAEIIEYNRRFKVNYYNDEPATYADAFKKARSTGTDYFGILTLDETSRDIELVLTLYVSRTGSLAKTFTIFRSGNERYANALLRLSDMLADSMPYIAKIVKRDMSRLLIDLGKNDGKFDNMEFVILEDGTLNFAKDGIGLIYNESSVLGTFLPARSEEDLTSGTFRRAGFYDRVNEQDWCIAVPKDTSKEQVDFINVNNRQPILLQQLKEIRKSR